MTTRERRRILSAAYRILDNREDAQYRALDRLTRLTDFAVALDVWLKTKPDPVIVEKVISFHLLQSAMRNVRIGTAIKAAQDFRQSLTTLQNQAGQPATNLAPLSAAIIQMAKEDKA